jgi:hypothetical protein
VHNINKTGLLDETTQSHQLGHRRCLIGTEDLLEHFRFNMTYVCSISYPSMPLGLAGFRELIPAAAAAVRDTPHFVGNDYI